MPLLNDCEIAIGVDQVLRAQGADPAVVRSRRPKPVEAAEWALELGLSSIEPSVLYESFAVKEVRHESLALSRNGGLSERLRLRGRLLASQLSGARRVIAALCTIGERLEAAAVNLMDSDPVKALALEGVGSAATEALALSACNRFEAQAAAEGLKSTLPLSPGMIDWPVEVGQPQIFQLLRSEIDRYPAFRLSLSPSAMMLPRKSVSFVLGLGSDVNKQGKPCDYCTVKETCRYQNEYA